MKKSILLGISLLLAGPLLAAGPKDDVTAAAKKLAGDSYSWTQTMDLGPNAPFTPPPSDGKISKDGTASISTTFQDNTSMGLKKGDKVAVKTDAGWQTAAEATAGGQGGGGGGGFNPAAFMARRMQNLKTPADEVQDLITNVTELKKDGDALTGDFSEAGAKNLVSFGFRGRGGRTPPPVTDAKGSLKIWLKDGALTKYEYKVSGKRDNNGESQDIERTTTIEIKDVGKTTVEMPDDAKKKLE
jgi:hypothetical protein